VFFLLVFAHDDLPGAGTRSTRGSWEGGGEGLGEVGRVNIHLPEACWLMLGASKHPQVRVGFGCLGIGSSKRLKPARLPAPIFWGTQKTFRNQEMLQSVAAMWRSKLGILGKTG